MHPHIQQDVEVERPIERVVEVVKEVPVEKVMGMNSCVAVLLFQGNDHQVSITNGRPSIALSALVDVHR